MKFTSMPHFIIEYGNNENKWENGGLVHSVFLSNLLTLVKHNHKNMILDLYIPTHTHTTLCTYWM